MSPAELLQQAALALLYYAGLIVIFRFAGKRLAGQTTTFDLIVLITLAVVLQTAALKEGVGPALVFVVTVFFAHRALSMTCARSPFLRKLVRGGPRPLVRNGCVLYDELQAEGLTADDLDAGLRKLGYASAAEVRLAVLEEAGHISAIPRA